MVILKVNIFVIFFKSSFSAVMSTNEQSWALKRTHEHLWALDRRIRNIQAEIQRRNRADFLKTTGQKNYSKTTPFRDGTLSKREEKQKLIKSDKWISLSTVEWEPKWATTYLRAKKQTIKQIVCHKFLISYFIVK